ncbi:MAG: hypothetical protein U0X76_05720 [Bacteroidia bacterium]
MKKPLKNVNKQNQMAMLHRNCSVSLIAFVCCLQTFFSYAQTADTIAYSLKQKPRFFLSLASFNTFIDHDFASFGGGKAGLDFNHRIRFGLGYLELTNNSVVSDVLVNDGVSEYVTNGQLEMSYFSLSAEYSFRNNFPWHFAVVPFQTGFGSAHYEYISHAEKKRVSTPSEFIILYQPEVNVQYSIIRWFAVGVTSGYRFTILRSKKQTRNFNAINFSFDISISLDELYAELVGPN